MSVQPTLVIGVGNRDRGDDAAGPEVCDRVANGSGGRIRTVVLESSAIDLAARWDSADRVVIVDAGRPAGEPGRVTEYDALVERFAVPGGASTHSIDVAGGIELARALGRLPAALTVVAIEGVSFDFRVPPVPPVLRSIDETAARLVAG